MTLAERRATRVGLRGSGAGARYPQAVTVPLLPAEARDALLDWFDATGRAFPFRAVRDPYAILVSETMAQQTQIARASERWGTFMARFPTVDALAEASPADVLREWRGLGYNRRAINLQRAAREIVARHDGTVPDDLRALEALPGVGPYTARAVAALAFGRRVGAVDTNVRRVLGRVVGGISELAPRELQAIADDAVPGDRPGDWTHALMDVGATICRPARPDCAACPVQPWCRYAVEPALTVAIAAAVEPGAPAGSPSGRRRIRTTRGLPFPSTTRWLRGRLLDRLRDATDEGWIAVDPPLGQHGPDAILHALESMAGDGLIERHPADPMRARLPLG